jgi:hypothetical protein
MEFPWSWVMFDLSPRLYPAMVPIANGRWEIMAGNHHRASPSHA